MKETKTSTVMTFVAAVVMVVIVVVSVVNLKSRAKVSLERTSYPTIRITPEQFWQSFPS